MADRFTIRSVLRDKEEAEVKVIKGLERMLREHKDFLKRIREALEANNE